MIAPTPINTWLRWYVLERILRDSNDVFPSASREMLLYMFIVSEVLNFKFQSTTKRSRIVYWNSIEIMTSNGPKICELKKEEPFLICVPRDITSKISCSKGRLLKAIVWGLTELSFVGIHSILTWILESLIIQGIQFLRKGVLIFFVMNVDIRTANSKVRYYTKAGIHMSPSLDLTKGLEAWKWKCALDAFWTFPILSFNFNFGFWIYKSWNVDDVEAIENEVDTWTGLWHTLFWSKNRSHAPLYDTQGFTSISNKASIMFHYLLLLVFNTSELVSSAMTTEKFIDSHTGLLEISC